LDVIASAAKHPLKGLCQEKKVSPARVFILFVLGKYSELEFRENVTFTYAEISTRTMSAPISGLRCTKHPSGSESGDGYFLVFSLRL
jgi:hypothetical protein